MCFPSVPELRSSELSLAKWVVRSAAPRRLRSRLEWAEQELVLPDGPYKGQRFNTRRQPVAYHLLDGMDTMPQKRRVVTGPSQSGKTLAAFIVPLLWHLFEVEENTGCGLPTIDMAADKWREDIKPVIEKTRYRKYLPRSGPGSRDGTTNLTDIRFENGVTLKFFGAGGGDKQRAGYTVRPMIITETDGMQSISETSDEADPIEQLEARTRSYGDNAEIYMECTVSTDAGRTWTEYQSSTQSRVVVQCPGCRLWTSPEREHFVGWEGADDEVAAAESATWCCPECGVIWDDANRPEMLHNSRMVHAGQEITPEGDIVGVARPTNTFGYRWSAFHNLFVTTRGLGAAEYKASNAEDNESAERALKQFWYATPIKSDDVASALDHNILAKRTNGLERGKLPPDTVFLVAAVDVGKSRLHWAVAAGTARGTIEVIDYGIRDVQSNNYGEKKAIRIALDWFDQRCREGWGGRCPDARAYDSGYQGGGDTDELVVYDATREHGRSVLPSKGFGVLQQAKYTAPNNVSDTVPHIGDRWHIKRLKKRRIDLLEFDADAIKMRVHKSISQPVETPGSLRLFESENESEEKWRRHHKGFARELTSEKAEYKTSATTKVVLTWKRIGSRQNHFLDVVVMLYVRLLTIGFRPGYEHAIQAKPEKKRKRPRPPVEEIGAR